MIGKIGVITGIQIAIRVPIVVRTENALINRYELEVMVNVDYNIPFYHLFCDPSCFPCVYYSLAYLSQREGVGLLAN